MAVQLLTPRDVVEYVLSRLALVEQAPCLHTSAFHLVRRGFGQHLRLPREAFRLDRALVVFGFMLVSSLRNRSRCDCPPTRP